MTRVCRPENVAKFEARGWRRTDDPDKIAALSRAQRADVLAGKLVLVERSLAPAPSPSPRPRPAPSVGLYGDEE